MEGDLPDVTAMFAQAPLDPALWPRALEGFARLAGGWGAQLLGVSQGRLVLNIGGGTPAAAMASLAAGWAAETSNGYQAPSPFTIDDIERQPSWRAFIEEVDGAHSSLTALGDDEDVGLFAAVLRSHPRGKGSQAVALLAPSILAAARSQMKLEARSTAITVAALDRLGVCVLVCDAFGRVVAASEQGAGLLAARVLLTDRGGRLSAAHPRSDRQLQAAIASAGAIGSEPGQEALPVFLVSADGRDAATADVRALHAGVNAIAVPGRVMVVVGAPPGRTGVGLLAHLGLTEAEIDVARSLADGDTPIAISRRRKVSIATVRAQIRTVFGKLEVSRVSELIMKVRSNR